MNWRQVDPVGVGRAIEEAVRRLDRDRAQLHNALACMEESMAPTLESLRDIVRSLDMPQTPFLTENLWRQDQARKALDNAGWLPHPAILDDVVLNACEDKDIPVSVSVEQYVAQNWTMVSAVFRRGFESSSIDTEALAAMNEALQCRGYNLHRATCRIVFPEIERIARIRLSVSNPTRMASLVEIRKAIGGLTPYDFRITGLAWLSTFKHIRDSCYAEVNAEATVDDFPMPNRHAVTHGRFPYSTPRDSMNALVIADFMFSAVDALVAQAE